MRSIAHPFSRLLPLLLWVDLASVASAQMAPPQPPKLESLDVVAMESDVIFVGTVATYLPDAKFDEAIPIEFDVRETLKGAPEPRRKLTPQQCFGASFDVRYRNSRLYLVAIGAKQTRFQRLDHPKVSALSGDLVPLESEDAILAELRKSIVRTRGPDRGSFGEFVPRARYARTRIDDRYWEGDYTVQVPIDERLEARAQRAIRDGTPAARENAVEALRFFPSEANLGRLRSALRDPFWAFSTYGRGERLLTYRYAPVRRAAAKVLTQLGHYVSVPFSDPPDEDGRVVWVTLGPDPIPDRQWAALPRYRNLQNLYLCGANLTPAQFRSIGNLRSLRRLFLDGSNVTDIDLSALSPLPKLEYLSLMNTQISEADLRSLASLKSLRRVDLPTPLKGRSLAALRPDVQLRLDPFASLFDLNPRRVEATSGPAARFWVGPNRPPGSDGLREWILIFPKEHAAVAEERLKKLLLATGWQDNSYPNYFYLTRRGVTVRGYRYDSVTVDRESILIEPGEKGFRVTINLQP